MLIKEYHIPLPLSVEEYRVAQLYMIAVSSTVECSHVQPHPHSYTHTVQVRKLI